MAGEPGESPIRFELANTASVQLSAVALERGGERFEGRLGDGTGKWTLHVRESAAHELDVQSIVTMRSGAITNLSR